MNYSEMEESNYSKYFHVLPSSIKLEEIILANPPKFKYDIEFFAHLVHLTISIPARNKELRSRDGFVPFCASILQKKNREYRKHLDYLVENKILETKDQYICGEQCKSFRIAEKYLTEKLIEVIVTNKVLIKHVAEEYGFKFEAIKKHKHLKKWFNEKLTIDDDSAIAHCINMMNQSTENIYERYQKAYGKILMIKMIKHKLIWFTVDSFGNRLHTNLSNISSDLRPFIQYNNETLVSIDIKNSQPYFSLLLLKERYPEEIEYTKKNSNSSIPIMLVNSAEKPNSIDVCTYTNLVVSGTLYKYMEEEIRKELGDKYFTKPYLYDYSKGVKVKNNLTPKQMVKSIMFQIFFSKGTKSNKERDLFKRLFPNVLKAFDEYKQMKGMKKEYRYKQLAKKLQRIESNTILNIATKELNASKPYMPLFTIHDSIVTTEKNKEFVENELKRILLGIVGFAPELHTEYWFSECPESRIAA